MNQKRIKIVFQWLYSNQGLSLKHLSCMDNLDMIHLYIKLFGPSTILLYKIPQNL